MICEHGSVLVVWNEDGSLDHIWCGVCEGDVTCELQDEEVMRVLAGEAIRRTGLDGVLESALVGDSWKGEDTNKGYDRHFEGRKGEEP